ncbi:MAG: hypothetical protein NW201_05345 [Gemmatimonadales bacterium]|nr:hypothetical protein [Gemmatimonadales bacterium]
MSKNHAAVTAKSELGKSLPDNDFEDRTRRNQGSAAATLATSHAAPEHHASGHY